MELGYARVSTTRQDLDRQIDALTAAGIAPGHVYADKKSGATAGRPGLKALLDYCRGGDVIVVHTLDRLGRTVRDTLNLIRQLRERGVGVRNLADPIRVDSASPEDPMAQLAVVLLALFAQMERTYTLERAAHARAVATAKGRRVGRPSVVTESQLVHATQLRADGRTIAEITAATGLTRSTLYRHLPARGPEPVTAAAPATDEFHVPSRTAAIANETLDILGLDMRITEDEILNEAGFVGAGYGIPTEASVEATKLFARTEGVILDPVYTGKAAACMVAHIREGRYARTNTLVFVHTGGTPAVFTWNALWL